MNKILVTGGMGFIGSHTVDKLIDKGYEVRVLDNLEEQVHLGKKPDYLNQKAEYIIGDVRKSADWKKALENVEYVIHLAAAVGVGQSFWQPKKYMEVNATGTAILYEILTKNKKIKDNIKKIVVASSKSIYGEGAYRCKVHGLIHPPVRSLEQMKDNKWEVKCQECSSSVEPTGIFESKPAQNLNPYALSKYCTERLAIDYSYSLSIPTVAFRYFNVYGPRQSLSNPYTGILAMFLSRVKNDKPPIIFEDGKQLRDFIYVEDIAEFNLKALENGEGVYNLGTGKTNSLISLAEEIKKQFNSDVELNITGEFRPGDNRHDFANISKLTKDFGSYNFKDISKGMESLIEFGKQAEAIDFSKKSEQERKKYIS